MVVKSLIIGLFVCTALIPASAQYTIRFLVTIPSDADPVYLAGVFTNWNPRDEKYKLQFAGRQQRSLLLHDIKAGKYDFKFTKGSWGTEEADATGGSDQTRTVIITSDTTIYCQVAAWIDDYFDLSNLPDRAKYYAMMSRVGYYLEKNLDSSYQYSKELYRLSLTLDSAEAEARALDLQGLVFTKLGNGQKALALFFKGVEIKKQSKDSSGVSFTYHSIGEVYETQKDTVKALENYRQSAAWTEQRFAYYASVPLTKIGTLLLNQGNTDSALYYAKKAIEAGGQTPAALVLMGDIYKKLNDKESAVTYYRQSVAKELYSGFSSASLAEAYKGLAEVMYNKAMRDSAFYYARKAYATALGVKNPFIITNTINLLINLFRKEKQYDSALFYEDKVINANDSLFTQERQRQIHNIYFNEQLRRQELEVQNEKLRSQTKLYILAGILALVVIAGLSYRARLRSGFYKQLAEIEMKALRAQMNPHFIFNCLASINRYIVKSDAKVASGYLTKFSKLIRLILDNSSSEYIPLDVEIQTLKLYLDMESLRFDHSFDYDIQQDDYTLAENIMIPTMVVQPYIENAIWHGLLHKDHKGRLSVRFKKTGNDILQVEIEDDGIGRKKAAELRSRDTLKTRSYGMKISEERIQIINARYNIQSAVAIEDITDEEGNAAGTKVVVQLPLLTKAATALHE